MFVFAPDVMRRALSKAGTTSLSSWLWICPPSRVPISDKPHWY